MALLSTHLGHIQPAALNGPVRAIAGVLVGAAIGVVAALMGVAGGELLIPTFVLLYGIDTKVAGSLPLAVSLPTMLVAFASYTRVRSFIVLAANEPFVSGTAAGSVIGTVAGGALLDMVPAAVLIPLLALLPLHSARKVWQPA